MAFRVGEQYTPGPDFSDVMLREQNLTRETILTVARVEGVNSDIAYFGEQLHGGWFNINGRWFTPVEHYLVYSGDDGFYVLDGGRMRMTLQEAQDIIRRDIGPSETVHIVPLRSIFQYATDEDGNLTTTDHRNVQQEGA